jgi:formylglycine-generating enzyme required for sulfatase activity
MKQLLFSIMVVVGISASGQNTVAKFKYEDAEKAYYDNKFEDCIQLLTETETLLGQTAPNILHLRILAEHKLLEQNPMQSYALIENLRNHCNMYLQNYDIAGLEEKYRDVYTIKNALTEYPLTKEAFNSIVNEIESELKAFIKKLNINENMVSITGGTFIMGSKKGNYNFNRDEHEVTVSDFKMSKYEITVSQYQMFINATGYKDTTTVYKDFVKGKLQTVRNSKNPIWKYDTHDNLISLESYNNPVINVSWNDAMAFCKWLTGLTGIYYRLPTEAEWEYVAKDDKNATEWWKKNYDDLGWFKENASGNLQSVGQKKPNEWGIFDLYGNVKEWCFDWYDNNYYEISSKEDPAGPKTGQERVVRGKDILYKYSSSDEKENPITYRYWGEPNEIKIGWSLGFRVVSPSTVEGNSIGKDILIPNNQ